MKAIEDDSRKSLRKGVLFMKQILLVNDETAICDVFAGYIADEFEDVEFNYATNNSQAIAQCKENRPNLIISDIVRPGGNGLEFLQTLQQDDMLWDIPVLIYSGQAISEYELKAYRLGARAVAGLPPSRKHVVHWVYRLLSIKEPTEEDLLKNPREMLFIDYKRALDLSDKNNVASLAKDVIAFANSGGGTIIIGYHEYAEGKFHPEGIPAEFCTNYEVTKFNRKLSSYCDPQIHVGLKVIARDQKDFCILNIPTAKSPILPKKENEKAKLRTGGIYIRNKSCETSAIQTSEEMRDFLARFGAQSVNASKESTKRMSEI